MVKETAEYSMDTNTGGVAIEMGSSGEEEVKKTPVDAIEFYTDDVRDKKEKKAPDANAEDTGDDAGEESAHEDGDADGDTGEDSPVEDLGEFDPEDPEVVGKFDSKYTNEDGDIAEDVLSAEYFANLDAGTDGLNEATYAYLASKGISKATVKKVEAMAATQRDADTQSVASHDNALFEIAGGPDVLQEALKWGKEGGYSEAQQKRFNEITKGTDLESKQEAVEALMARYHRANPPAKPKLPKRDATKGQGKTNSGVKPFKDRAEMRAFRDSLRENDTAGWETFKARRKASKSLG